jgi:septum formation protein
MIADDQRLQGATEVILASASPSRTRLLAAAGVAHVAVPALIAEDTVKQSLRAEGASPLEVAETLAELKALRVSAQHPGRLVIGADQMLVCGDDLLDKPEDLDRAARHLALLSGRAHELPTAAVVVLDGRRIWHHRDTPRLTMRPLSDTFIADYLGAVGDAALSSVGAYQLEGRGAQLFEKIEGDFFTILGLPLLPLLGFLRARGALAQ